MTEELLDVPFQFFSSYSVKVKKLATGKDRRTHLKAHTVLNFSSL